VTICLASIASKGKYIIGICDTMISSDDWSGDRMALKASPLPNDWCVMIAGNQSALKASADKGLKATVDYFQQAFQDELHARIRQILAP
jgi:hypothetical protein